jgi:epoxyqueuosine reductase QueG
MNVRSMELENAIRTFVEDYLDSISCKGVVGFAVFKSVYDELMPIQKEKLEDIAADRFDELMESGSVVSFGIAYQDTAIDAINKATDGATDYELWNFYSREYARLNRLLDQTSHAVADRFDGIPVTATLQGLTYKVKHVTDYYGLTISHRVVAEMAGLGWRGKNGLLINEKFSCAIRFASVLTTHPLTAPGKMDSQCDKCHACEDVCTFIKNREKLPDYRENCRKYIVHLQSEGLTHDVCGKCIKACYQQSIFSEQFKLE